MTERIAVIGTAGRSAEDPPPNAREMAFVMERVREALAEQRTPNTVLVSGGSSGVDHAAVLLFLERRDTLGLVLELPAPWDATRSRFTDATKEGVRLNALHEAFSRGTFDSLWQLDCAISGLDEHTGELGAKPATVNVHAGGFLARNAAVAHTDRMLAFTRAPGPSPPAGSGTLNTWMKFDGALRTHYTLPGPGGGGGGE